MMSEKTRERLIDSVLRSGPTVLILLLVGWYASENYVKPTFAEHSAQMQLNAETQRSNSLAIQSIAASLKAQTRLLEKMERER